MSGPDWASEDEPANWDDWASDDERELCEADVTQTRVCLTPLNELTGRCPNERHHLRSQ